MTKETKFKVGDKAVKVKGYKFPCTIVSVFETVEGNVRVVGEMDDYGLLHIFNEEQLEKQIKMDLGKEFRSFAKSEGISSLALDQFEASLTPYILEERELRATQIDIFSRLMRDRILWLSGPVDQRMSDIVQPQLLFLDSVEKKDITLYINSPGGSVMCGLGIVDLMNYVSSDIVTTNLGMCASMGSVLLSSGTKGKRSSLIHSKVMTHQVSHGTRGNIQDTRINQMEGEKYNYILFKILAENCGKTFQEVLDFSSRDRWYSSDEAVEFGLIDEVIGSDKNKSITNYLEGFDDYYKKEVLNVK